MTEEYNILQIKNIFVKYLSKNVDTYNEQKSHMFIETCMEYIRNNAGELYFEYIWNVHKTRKMFIRLDWFESIAMSVIYLRNQ
jgi:hypothetical protein